MRKAVLLIIVATVLSMPVLSCASKGKVQADGSKNAVKAVTINGMLLSTDIKVVNGKAYVPVADLAKLMSLSTHMDLQTGTLILTGKAASNVSDSKAAAAKNALSALEALQSVVESGVSYRDYGTRAADAKIVVDRFLNNYPKHPAVGPIADAMMHYKAAGSFWEIYFSNDYDHDFLLLSDPQVALYVNSYPEIESKATDMSGRKMIYLAYALNIIWNKASESIAKARSVLK
jgi:hypothetical protein